MASKVKKGFEGHILHEGSFIGGKVIDVMDNIVLFKSYDDDDTAILFTHATFAMAVGRGVIFDWNTFSEHTVRKNDTETTPEPTA